MLDNNRYNRGSIKIISITIIKASNRTIMPITITSITIDNHQSTIIEINTKNLIEIDLHITVNYNQIQSSYNRLSMYLIVDIIVISPVVRLYANYNYEINLVSAHAYLATFPKPPSTANVRAVQCCDSTAFTSAPWQMSTSSKES